MASSSRETEALVREFFTSVVDGGDTDAVEVLLANDVVDHHLVFGRRHGGPDVDELGWRVLAAADVSVEIDDVIATTDRAAVRGTVSGTHRESLMDLAPTGATFEIAVAWFCRIENGELAEIWSLPDGLGLMRQLDAIPDRQWNRHSTDINTEVQ